MSVKLVGRISPLKLYKIVDEYCSNREDAMIADNRKREIFRSGYHYGYLDNEEEYNKALDECELCDCAAAYSRQQIRMFRDLFGIHQDTLLTYHRIISKRYPRLDYEKWDYILSRLIDGQNEDSFLKVTYAE